MQKPPSTNGMKLKERKRKTVIWATTENVNSKLNKTKQICQTIWTTSLSKTKEKKILEKNPMKTKLSTKRDFQEGDTCTNPQPARKWKLLSQN